MEDDRVPQTIMHGYGGRPLACKIYGHRDDPPLLLIPGATSHDSCWSDLADTLARAGRFVHVLDLRGHGGSPPSAEGVYDLDELIADLRQVIRSFESRPVIVAATLAAWIALIAVGEGEPDLTASLVLIEASDRHDPDRLEAATHALVELMQRGGATPFDPTMIGQLDPQEILARARRASDTLRVPVLLLRGENSELTSRESLAAFAESLRNGETADVPAAGQLNLECASVEQLATILIDFLERTAPRSPIEYVEGSDARTLRDAMGCYATGVTVVTTRAADGRPVGFTANSFTSVSLDPPLLLVCPARSAGSLPAFEFNGYFAINVLHIGQQDCSNGFAKPAADKFANVEWECWRHDVPIISSSLVSFECEKHSMIVAGDHMILMGRVVRASYEPRRDPLLFFRGKYRKLHFA
jgi:flavin reductase (DIM6/NTAB) family NADH-FMN oxidoreductase RutF/pimeloyl-ACP methyl ester carboxylesterase